MVQASGDVSAVELRVAVSATPICEGASSGFHHSRYDEIDRADVVLHAGDVLDGDALDALTALVGDRPFHVVLGNNDHELVHSLPGPSEVGRVGRGAGRHGARHRAAGRAGNSA